MVDENETGSASGTDVVAEGNEEKTSFGTGDVSSESTSVYDYINEDGTFKEGWKEAFLDEDSRSSPIYDRAKDIKDILKTVGHQERQISKKGIIPIDENSSEQEVAEYCEAMGIPPDGDYKMEIPKGMEEYYNHPITQRAREVAFENKITQKQFDAIMELDRERERMIKEATDDMFLQAEMKAENAINKMFGANKKKEVHNANLAINELTKEWTPEERLMFTGTDEEPAGINSPQFAPYRHLLVRMMAKMGSYFSEDGGVKTAALADADTIDAQIGVINEQLTEQLKRTNRKKYNELVKQKDELYKRRFPEPT